MKPEDVDLVVYHAQCTDGFGAAWAAYKLLGESATYVAAIHGDPPPDVDGKHVAIVDYSYSRADLERMAQRSKGIVVLDHHRTAAAELEGLPYAHFDMHRSGAMMSWEWFHPGKAIPQLIAYVQDHDLWRHALVCSRMIQAALQAIPQHFGAWDHFSSHLETEAGLLELASRGGAVVAHQKLAIERLAATAVRAVEYESRTPMWIVNATDHFSELGNYLAENSREGVAAIWRFDHVRQELMVSLRAVERAGVDVSAIAKSYGGGGHKLAAGFNVPGGGEKVWFDWMVAVAYLPPMGLPDPPIAWAQRERVG